MILKYFTDNDLYKFTTMYAIQKLYPHAVVRYKFINRGNTQFPEKFAEMLQDEVNQMKDLCLAPEEEEFLRTKCYYFDPVFIDFLKGYRYNPNEVKIKQLNGVLELEIEGYWFRTVLWEVPLMALISELYFQSIQAILQNIDDKAIYKGEQLKKMEAQFSDFGTRRRFSFEVHQRVLKGLKKGGEEKLSGTSNVYLAMKEGLTPIGTHPHEWFMFHGARFGYKMANHQALKSWAKVYGGTLGIALTDTYTTANFFESFNLMYAKLFDGLRWDSGDPVKFTDDALRFYQKMKIDSTSKTIVYSDSLNLEKVREIRKIVKGRFKDAYGIGTYFTNDVGAEPLNMVIKLTHAANHPNELFHPVVKLSDVPGKHTGDQAEINLCKQILRI